MSRRSFLCILLSAALLLAACSTPGADQLCTDVVYILSNEKELKEQLLQSKSIDSYGLTHYYRPASEPENLTFKEIQLTPYNILFTYIQNMEADDTEYSFVWCFSQLDGDAVLEDSIDRLEYKYVCPENPIEGVKYLSDLDRDEARKAGRVSWDVEYSVNGVLFRASVPWDIRDEDITKFLIMEKVPFR